MVAHQLGRIDELLRGLKLRFRADDLRPAHPFGLGLARHRPADLFRQVDLLDFHRGDLDPPRLGLLVDDGLEALVEFIAMNEELIQLHLSQHAA